VGILPPNLRGPMFDSSALMVGAAMAGLGVALAPTNGAQSGVSGAAISGSACVPCHAPSPKRIAQSSPSWFAAVGILPPNLRGPMFDSSALMVGAAMAGLGDNNRVSQ
jgi:hypothetical protein